MKSCKMAFLCIVLSAACIAQAKDTLFPPIAPDPLIISNPFTPDLMPIPEPIEAGRKLCVRPDVPGTEDYDWLYFPPFQKPPATPDQSTILLTDADLLVIAVPMFAFRPQLGGFDTIFIREGSQLRLDAYTLLSGVMTATIYGPHEYLKHIGSLSPGTYTLTVRNFAAMDCSAAYNFEAFKADPAGYVIPSMGSNLQISQQTLKFTVVPEPSTVVLLVIALVIAPPAIISRRSSVLQVY